VGVVAHLLAAGELEEGPRSSEHRPWVAVAAAAEHRQGPTRAVATLVHGLRNRTIVAGVALTPARDRCYVAPPFKMPPAAWRAGLRTMGCSTVRTAAPSPSS
jgi:hypothetical protein